MTIAKENEKNIFMRWVNGLACKAAGPIGAFKAFRARRCVRRFTDFCYSPLFVYILGVVTLGLNLLGVDELTFSVLLLTVAALLVFCPDALPALAATIFMSVARSQGSRAEEHDRSWQNFTTASYVILGIMLSIALAALLFHFLVNFRLSHLRGSRLTAGFVALTVGLLCNGYLANGYSPINIIKGLKIAGLMFGVYLLMRMLLRPTRETLRYFSYICLVLGLVIGIELCIMRCTHKPFIESGVGNKTGLFLGWGISNTIGEALFRCMPFCFYLACTESKHNWYYFAAATLIMLATPFSYGRAAIVFTIPIYAVCYVLCCILSKQRGQLLLCGGVCLALLFVFLLVFRNDLGEIFEFFLNRKLDDSGRYPLWDEAVRYFLRYPVFGVGYNRAGNPITQYFYHNTPLHFLATGGVVGIAGYLLHRMQAAALFTQKPTIERLFSGILLGGILLISLLDCFYMYRNTQIFVNFILIMAEYDLNKRLPFAYRFCGYKRLY